MKLVILKRRYFYKQIIVLQNLNFILLRNIRRSSMGAVDSDNSWRGVPISEMYGSQSPWGSPEFPLVTPGYKHTVLYHVSGGDSVGGDRPPKPQIGQDKWDQEHVRMPHSSQSLYPVQDSKGEIHLKKRWEMIESALSKRIHNSQELAEAILSYNTKFRSIWKFRGLHKLFNEHLEEEETQYFFNVTLPEMAKLALNLPKLVQAPIPLLKQHRNHSISLSQQQIASLLANAFFCTFPRRNSRKSTSEYASYPYINFNTSRLYESTDSDSNLEKLKCICHYFRRVCTKGPATWGAVSFCRRGVAPRACPAWGRAARLVSAAPLHVDPDNTIEDACGLIQVDFANKFLGGGVLGHGCVQEEIRFAICPELMVSMLFTEVLRPNEALMIIGCERYSKYTGYGSSFQWAGDFVDNTPRDSSGRRRCAVLAIDAEPLAATAATSRQYTRPAIDRELNKAWVGFSFDTAGEGGDGGDGGDERDEAVVCVRYPGVATGNWGCGAFGGSPHLKCLLQAMAAAQAARPMAYYTFGDLQLRDYIINVYNLLARYNVTVGQLYKYLIQFSEKVQKNVTLELYPYLERVIKHGHATELAHSDSAANTESEAPPDDKEITPADPHLPETVISIEEEIANSPDLFSQEENMDVSITPPIEIQDTSTDTKTNKQENTRDEREANRMSLYDTMQKMDDDGGRPNPSVSNTSLLGLNKHGLNDSTSSMDSEQRSESAMTPKKKVVRPITYYFKKK